jgi:hypothetical protein
VLITFVFGIVGSLRFPAFLQLALAPKEDTQSGEEYAQSDGTAPEE